MGGWQKELRIFRRCSCLTGLGPLRRRPGAEQGFDPVERRTSSTKWVLRKDAPREKIIRPRNLKGGAVEIGKPGSGLCPIRKWRAL